MKSKLFYFAFAITIAASAQVPVGELHSVQFEKTECITDSQRQEVRQQFALNKQQILRNNPNAFQRRGGSPLFIFPIRPKAGFGEYGYYSVYNFVDHNST